MTRGTFAGLILFNTENNVFNSLPEVRCILIHCPSFGFIQKIPSHIYLATCRTNKG